MELLIIVEELNYCGGRCMKGENETDDNSEKMFRYKLGKWELCRKPI